MIPWICAEYCKDKPALIVTYDILDIYDRYDRMLDRLWRDVSNILYIHEQNVPPNKCSFIHPQCNFKTKKPYLVIWRTMQSIENQLIKFIIKRIQIWENCLAPSVPFSNCIATKFSDPRAPHISLWAKVSSVVFEASEESGK